MAEPVGLVRSGVVAIETGIAGFREYKDMDRQIVQHNSRHQQLELTTTQLDQLSDAQKSVIEPSLGVLKDIRAASEILQYGTAKDRLKWKVAHQHEDQKQRTSANEAQLSTALSLLASLCLSM